MTPWVRLNYVLEQTGWARTTFGKKVRKGLFPPHDRKDGKFLVWRKTHVDKWIAAGKHLEK